MSQDTNQVEAITGPRPKFPNPRDPNWVSQLKKDPRDRAVSFKVAKLEDKPRFLRDSIATPDVGKRLRISKARI